MGLTALGGLAGIVGKLATGWILDRVQGSIVPFLSFALAMLGYALLIYGAGSKPALSLAVCLTGYSGGASLQITTYMISRYAGMRNFGKIFGTISSAMMLGTSIGPVFAGHMFDISGNYSALLTLGMPAALVCALCFVGLGPYPVFPAREKDQDDCELTLRQNAAVHDRAIRLVLDQSDFETNKPRRLAAVACKRSVHDPPVNALPPPWHWPDCRAPAGCAGRYGALRASPVCANLARPSRMSTTACAAVSRKRS